MTVTNSATDKNGIALAIGDEVTFRGPVVEMREGSVLTRIHTANMGIREQWFHGSWVERSAQGAASVEADKKIAAAAPAAPAAPAAVVELSPKEQAIAFVMANAPYTREEAEKIVEEHGTRTILLDRDEAEELAKSAGKTGTDGGGANAPATTTPATSTDASTQSANTAAQNEAPAPAAKPAGTEGTSAA